ncbi:MAG TPA: hypothetical protein VMM59_13195, partial [Thermohalobaculum sp.]|nr:hypothetical protein [Thermohalobaculum sp.]
NRVVDTLLNDLLDAIFQVNKASAGGGGGGGLLGLALKVFGAGAGAALGGGLGGGGFNFAANTGGHYAKGGVFARGTVVPFARGGVVTRPTMFPMANGLGLMGEAGPEAVMPLKRGPGGRLGVEASGGGTSVNIEIINNTGAEVSEDRQQTPDGERVRIVIGEMVASELLRAGSAPNRALSTGFGLRGVIRRR